MIFPHFSLLRKKTLSFLSEIPHDPYMEISSEIPRFITESKDDQIKKQSRIRFPDYSPQNRYGFTEHFYFREHLTHIY